jgi:hypothetical protein
MHICGKLQGHNFSKMHMLLYCTNVSDATKMPSVIQAYLVVAIVSEPFSSSKKLSLDKSEVNEPILPGFGQCSLRGASPLTSSLSLTVCKSGPTTHGNQP